MTDPVPVPDNDDLELNESPHSPVFMSLTDSVAVMGLCMLAFQASLGDGGEPIPAFCAGFRFELEDRDGDGLLDMLVSIDPNKLPART